MQIGKVHGRTISEFGAEIAELKRKISTDGKNRIDLPDHLSRDPRALIGQWISGIDKIYRKPASRKPDGTEIKNATPSQAQFEARNGLGKALWKVLTEHGLTQNCDQSQFMRRLHPYGTGFEPATSSGGAMGAKGNSRSFAPDPDNHSVFHGRWFSAMSKWGDAPDKLALALYEHLHIDEKRISGRSKKAPLEDKTMGLVVARAKGIESSVLPRSVVGFELKWGQTEIDAYFAFDIAAAVREDLNAEIKRAKVNDPSRKFSGRSLSPIVGSALAQHIERVNGSKLCAFDPSAGPSILALHDDVKRTYKRLCARRKDPADAFPANKGQLLALMGYQHGNRVRNQMIRMGRVAAYQGSSNDDLVRSHYWTSAGQTEIKESEVFVRLWVGAFTLAARSLRAWVDPTGKVIDLKNDDRDLTSAENIRLVVSDDAMINSAMERRGVYFGSTPELDTLGDEEKRNFVSAMMRYARSCRNQTFHLGARSTFLTEIQRELGKGKWGDAKTPDFFSLTSETVAAIGAIIHNDSKALGARLLADLSGASVADFSTKSQFASLYSEIVKAVKDAPEVSSGLPRLKLLLKRADGVRGYVAGLRGSGMLRFSTKLPPPPAPNDLGDPATKARYIALLRLYDGPFRAYASELSGQELAEPAQRAKEAATALARSVNAKKEYNEVMEGRSSQLRPPNPGETLREYHSALTGETATEFRVQMGYDSNSENARKQAEFIENYRRDMLSFIFDDYITTMGFGWILEISPGSDRSPATVLPEPINTQSQYEHWQATLYLLMHFVPAADVSNLLHQLRKWEALQGKYELNPGTDSTEQDTARRTALDLAKRFRDVLVLFLKTGEARFEGRAVPFDLEPFRNLFANPATFDRLFMATSTASHSADLVSEGADGDGQEMRLERTLRGLRQIVRYNHMPVLTDLFAQHKVQDHEVERLADLEKKVGDKSQISHAHELRTKLHDSFMARGRKEITADEQKDYERAIKLIEEHRFLVGRVYLGDHFRLHRLMMDVIGRLIDYAGAYERDTINFLKKARDLVEKTEEWAVKIAEDAKNSERTRTQKDLAHLNVLDRIEGTPDLTALINRVREMMGYDRKRKNAVSRSIIDLLARQGLTLEWTMNDHVLQDATISQTTIKHLGKVRRKDGVGFRITENRFSDDYLTMVASLFYGRVKKSKPKAKHSGGARDNKPSTAEQNQQATVTGKNGSQDSTSTSRFELGKSYEGQVVGIHDNKRIGFLSVSGMEREISFHISKLEPIGEDTIVIGRRYHFTVEKNFSRDGARSFLNATGLKRIGLE